MTVNKLSLDEGMVGLGETRLKINELIDDGIGSMYSSGWITTDGTTSVANGAELTINHNLGTSDVIVQVFHNGSASDTNAANVPMGGYYGYALSYDYGWDAETTSNNSINLILSNSGFLRTISGAKNLNSWGGATYCTHIKVVVTSGVSGDLIAEKAKATISFDGNSASIGTGDKSYNVSSVTDNATGKYTVNFTNAITNPIPIVSFKSTDFEYHIWFNSISSSSVQIYHGTQASDLVDADGVFLAVF